MPTIVDTNLLVLYIVGSTRRDLVEQHKRLRAYKSADFDLLVKTMSIAQGIVLTPNTLTETSNLLTQGIDEPDRTQLRRVLGLLVHAHQEQGLPSASVVDGINFLRLGLTDESILQLLPLGPYSLLTDDFDLYYAASFAGAAVINFTHLRAEAGLL
jgi:hypothetical protein